MSFASRGHVSRAFVTPLLRMVVLGVLLLPATIGTAQAAPIRLPEIRISQENRVPACVSPDRLMAYLTERNSRLDPRFKDIARWYKHYGEGWRVRWDYAFFQMAIETNFLSYRRPDGRMGDVNPRQNNFAGIGTTGGGVPGDSFPDVKTGVLAQIQHLVAYSGERLAEPVAPRTRLKQDHIVSLSQKLNRPVRFNDLARRWAVDPKYASSIEWVAGQFRARFCQRPDAPPPDEVAPSEARAAISKPSQSAQATRPAPAARERPPAPPKPIQAVRPPIPPTPAVRPESCQIYTASYGGRKTVLIRHKHADGMDLTALTVLEGFERSLTDTYIAERAPGGEPLGEFHDQEAALTKARELCPAA